MAISGMHLQLKENLEGKACSDLSCLASRVVQVEQCVQERERKRASRCCGSQLVSVVDAVEDSNYGESTDYTANILVVEIVKGKAYLCPALKLAKGKEKYEERVEYSFDISKDDQIFDYLLKDKQVKLLDSHKIPPPEEINGKKLYHLLQSHQGGH